MFFAGRAGVSVRASASGRQRQGVSVRASASGCMLGMPTYVPATMTDCDPPVTLVRADGSEPIEETQLPHEQLDVYDVLEDAYRIAMSWQGVSWAKGTTGDQLKRASSSAVLRYTEGYYADGGHKTAHWKAARASCGEATAAVQLLAIDGKVPAEEARRVRGLLSRAMRMLARLVHPR